MALEGLVLDGLDIDDGSTYRLVESLDIAPPPKRLLWIAGREGDILGDVPGSERRTVTFKVMVTGTTMDTALTALGALTDKLQKAERTNGGISLVWTPSGSSYSKTIKVLAGEITDLPLTPDALYFKSRPVVTVRLDCKPFLYGTETSYASVTSSAPHVVAMARSVAGDVAAEGRLILTDMASQERDFAEYGLDPDPVTMEDLALDYTPSLFLRLGSSSGLTDQSGNGYNGTAQGGVTVGGATSLLTGDDSAATDFDGSNDYISTTYGTPELYDSFAGKGSVALTTSDSGHAYSTRGSGSSMPAIISNKLTIPATSGAGIGYTQQTLPSNVQRIGGAFTFSPFTVTGGCAAFVVWKQTLLGWAGIPDSGCHFVITPEGQWIYGIWEAEVFDQIADGNIGALTADDTTEYEVDLVLSGDTATLYLPDGSTETVTDARIETLAGTFVTYEVYMPDAATMSKAKFTRTWADTKPIRGPYAGGTVRTYCGVASLESTATGPFALIGSSLSPWFALWVKGDTRNVELWTNTTSVGDWVGAWPAGTAAVAWALVVDDSTDTSELFINGVSKGTGPVAQPLVGTGTFQVGATIDVVSWNGIMQNVMVYERALTADEIRQLYLAARSPYLFDSSQLSTTGLAATGSTRSGAYDPVGSGNTVLRVTTQTNWVGSCETGAIPHYGPFRAKARIYTDATDAQIRVAYKSGDAPFKRLNPVVLASGLASSWQEVDLGMVDLGQVVTGTQKSVLRFEVKSLTAAKTFDIDYVELIPATRYGKARAPFVPLAAPAVFSAWTNFATESGAISGDTLDGGGTWTTAGVATDYSAAAGVITRATSSEASPRFAYPSGVGSAATDEAVAVDVKWASSTVASSSGVFVRYVDTSNYLAAYITATSQNWFVRKVIAGVGTTIATGAVTPGYAANTYYRLQLAASSSGLWSLAVNGFEVGSAVDIELMSTGTLNDGRVGVYDINTDSTPITRTFRNFAAWVFENDAAIFSGKTLEFRPDDTLRQDSGGTIYGRPSVARGPGVFIPQAGSESKVARVVAKACRNDIDKAARDNIADSTKLQVYATSRYLVTPR